MLKIRKVKSSEEMDRVIALDKIIFRGDDSPDFFNSVWWIVLDGKKIVGYACLGVRGQCAYMSRAGLLSQYYGQGVQSRLLAVREAHAKRIGCTVAKSEAVFWNTASLANMIKSGYKITNAKRGRRPPTFYELKKAL
jgi:GNAT superfamily N-acetyltransferase